MKLRDLFNMIGDIMILDLVYAIATVIVGFIVLVFVLKGAINIYRRIATGIMIIRSNLRDYKEMKQHKYLEDNINATLGDAAKDKTKKLSSNKILTEEMKDKLKADFKARTDDKVLKDLTQGEEMSNEEIDKIFGDNNHLKGNRTSTHDHRRTSLDRVSTKAGKVFESEDTKAHPELFTQMRELADDILENYNIKDAAKKLKVTTATIYSVRRGEITSLVNCKKYIRRFKAFIREEDDKKIGLGTEIAKEVSNPHDLANDLELNELNRLVDTGLRHMSQSELGLRMGVPQSAVSYISTRKVVRKTTVNDYIEKLQPIISRITSDINDGNIRL